MSRFFLAAAITIAAPAVAAQPVALSSDVKVEKLVPGQAQPVLLTPATVVPGDRLVFRTSYRNGGSTPATRVVLTNPVPAAVAWTGEGTSGLEVSVDGGRSFGTLATLKLRGANGQPRPATAADVTHLRWTLAAIAPGAAGQLSYRGVVR